MDVLKVYYDDWCPNCTRFMKFITKVDLFNVIEFKKLRDDKHTGKIDLKLAEKKMASTIDGESWYYGYLSIYKILVRVPLFWIFVPFLFFFKVFNLGDYLYNELALKRKIIPMHCDDHCEI